MRLARQYGSSVIWTVPHPIGQIMGTGGPVDTAPKTGNQQMNTMSTLHRYHDGKSQ